ncbi:hypothetical protein BCR32DRAFT_281214 [Anaeromyces robustus]|uniref:Uncharacterized protein n=1 Tax=Anaeromyces robustus TaxID=1754192 RepID=A0A1Y1X1U8_9FUNG|nr:hypothetical protein BCR32DRAFT_281214 [Anaeromyces robustus]|eukprot:ORX79662.1 hypothetical protein BCR32DRAFT_281214 [Anaeromyces robustus]
MLRGFHNYKLHDILLVSELSIICTMVMFADALSRRPNYALQMKKNFHLLIFPFRFFALKTFVPLLLLYPLLND